MSFKALLSILKVAAIVRHAFAAPIEPSDVVRRDTENSTITGPVTALHPVKPRNEVSLDKQVLPQTALTLLYQGPKNSSVDTSAALVTIPKLSHPVINAAGASAVVDVKCNGGQAQVVFANDEAYDKAASSWSSSGGFLLVTYSKSCGTGNTDDNHDFLLVQSIVTKSSDSLSVTVAYEDIEVDQTIDDDTIITVDLGTVSDEPTSVRRRETSKPKTLTWNSYPSKNYPYFGKAYEVYSSSQIDAYCVGCGTDGSLTFTATIGFSKKGIAGGSYATLDGKVNAAAYIGLDGKAKVKIPVNDHTLANFPIGPGIAVGKWITLGPHLTVAAGGSVSVDSKGKIVVGGKLTWPHVHAQLDIAGTGSKATGWTPSFKPHFAATGPISSSVDIHLTTTLGVGIDIGVFKLKIHKDIALVDQAGVSMTAAYDKKGDKCKGVDVSGYLYDNLSANLLIKTFPLAHWQSSTLSHCIASHGKTNVEVVGGSDDSDAALTSITDFSTDTSTATTSADTTATATDDAPAATMTTDDSDDESTVGSVSISMAVPTITPSGTVVRPFSTATAPARLRS